jgi:hypothetical protein
VNSARDAVFAIRQERPTYIGADLRSLLCDASAVAVAAHPAWQIEVGAGAVTVNASGQDTGADGLSVVRAVARAVWDAPDAPATIVAGDDTARAELQRWSLLGDALPLA